MVNEQSYTATLSNNVITDPSATLGDIHNQLYLMFHSLLEEIHNVYTSQDLVRVYITHEELVNTNIIVGPDYLGNINADTVLQYVYVGYWLEKRRSSYVLLLYSVSMLSAE